MKVGNYITTYDEQPNRVSPEIALQIQEEVRKKVESSFEKIIKKAKNYSIYFYKILHSQMLDSNDNDDVFYGLFFSKMRMEIDMKMKAAAAVGFDFFTKVKINPDDPNLTPEERVKAVQGSLYRTLNAEEYFIVFNPIQMALFTREERIAVVKHEINHMLRLHHLRMFDGKLKSKEEMQLENIVLDKEINNTFDNPGIKNLPGTKGHVPHVYPAVVKESYFLPAFKKGLITEKQFEEILSTNISAEKMKAILKEIYDKNPDFSPEIEFSNSEMGPSNKPENMGDGLNGTDDLDDIPDDELTPEEMKERIEELKEKIKELDNVLNQGNQQSNQQQNNQRQNSPQNNQQNNSQNKSQTNNSQDNSQRQDGNSQNQDNQKKEKNSSGKQQEKKQNSQNQNKQSQNNSQDNLQDKSQEELKKEYNKLVSELAKKMTEAYLKGLLNQDIDDHSQFIRNVPKNINKDVLKKKTTEKMQTMIEDTKKEFDINNPKNRGYMPSEFEKSYENIVNMLKPQNNYKQLLRHHIKNAEGLKSKNISTWDRRSIMDPFNPNIKGKKQSKKPPIALIIDVSGSMSDKEVLGAYGEIIGIIQEETKNGGAALRVLQADATVTMDEFLENPKKKDIAKIIKRTGSGGTYMEPAIKRALGIGTSLIELPNGDIKEVNNRKLLVKKSLGIRPRTVFIVTDGWIENDFEDIVPLGMPKDEGQSYLPPDVEIVWIVVGDFENNPKMARKKAENSLAFDYKKYGRQMKVIAIDKDEILKELKLTKDITNNPSI